MYKEQMAKEAKKSYVSHLLNGSLPEEVYEIYIKPEFSTAASS